MKKIVSLLLVLLLSLCAAVGIVDELTAQADVIIIGAGGAGMTAAIEAVDAGASVIILEKMDYAGGNFVRSEGGMNAAGTVYQKEQGIEDSPEVMVADTMIAGKEINDETLVTYMAEHSAESVDWLVSLGMDMSETAQGAGATYPRVHRSAGGAKIGGVLTPVLLENLAKRNVTILYGVCANELISQEDGRIVGVKATDKKGKEYLFHGTSVVIATGGFGANEALFSKYRTDLTGFSTTNHPGATGDGIVMAEAVGAALVDMDMIQTNPTVEPTTHIVLSETVRGNGAIMINAEGNRFISEMLTRDVLSAAILEQPGKYAYVVFDQRVMDRMAALQQDDQMGIVAKGETYEALAEAIQVPAEALSHAIESWNTAVATGHDEAFGRSTGMAELTQGPWYAIQVSPAVHYTMGGIQIDEYTHVLRADGTVIEGLYAAGEVTGGVHGANRLGGNAVTDAVVFGRQAGIQSSAYALDKGKVELVLPNDEEVVAEVNGHYRDGAYHVTATGRNGGIELTITVANGSITEILVGDNSETESIFSAVERELIPEIIRTQSTDLDVISGATMSSRGVLDAVRDALE